MARVQPKGKRRDRLALLMLALVWCGGWNTSSLMMFWGGFNQHPVHGSCGRGGKAITPVVASAAVGSMRGACDLARPAIELLAACSPALQQPIYVLLG